MYEGSRVEPTLLWIFPVRNIGTVYYKFVIVMRLNTAESRSVDVND